MSMKYQVYGMETAKISRVLSYKPEFMKFIWDDNTMKILKDQNHYPILKILRNEPLTVKELVIAYAEDTGKEKSNKTIYRYLKTFEEAGLIIPAGQLVVTGKTATETIYGRSARAFFLAGNKFIGNKESGISAPVSLALGKLLSPLFENKSANVEKLMTLMNDYSKQSIMELENLANLVGDDMMELIADYDLKEISTILEFTLMFSYFKANPETIKRLADCYST